MKCALVFALTILGLAVIASAVMPSHAATSAISGTVYWYDQYGNLHPLSWVQISATSDATETAVTSSAVDGTYVLYVAAGTYNVTVSGDPGYYSQSKTVSVSPGGIAGGVDFQLEPTGKPVPEYPETLVPILTLVVVAATAIMIRRRIPQSSP